MSFITGNGKRLDIGYALTVVAATTVNPIDSTTYYIGSKAVAWQTTNGTQRIFVPKAGTIRSVYLEWDAGTAGTAEDVIASLRLNDTTDIAIATVSTNAAQKLFSNTALNTQVVAGDFVEIKLVTPAWVTNPANVTFGGQIYIGE